MKLEQLSEPSHHLKSLGKLNPHKKKQEKKKKSRLNSKITVRTKENKTENNIPLDNTKMLKRHAQKR